MELGDIYDGRRATHNQSARGLTKSKTWHNLKLKRQKGFGFRPRFENPLNFSHSHI
jgi:hypothetical protein